MKLEDLKNELDRRHAVREESAQSIQAARAHASRCIGMRVGLTHLVAGKTLDSYDSIRETALAQAARR